MVEVVIVIISAIVVPIVSETEVGECQDQEGEDEVHNALIVFVVVLSHYKGMNSFSFHQIFLKISLLVVETCFQLLDEVKDFIDFHLLIPNESEGLLLLTFGSPA